ncbi:WG repeat-containing protein [Aquipseudomonas alcaligenes]|uniref:WG repeat-containing protein n=1 Tax=Aquipseudomonas alcaligenes TaxID=43263 RepID=UPI001F432AB9|nr:WG repeat-containing protein [Pseudomonas alcaligenes]
MRLSKEGLKTRLGQTGRLAITTLALLAPLPTPAAEGGPDLIPLCGGPFQLCGYIEKNSREERIPPQFEVAHPFSEGLAAVRIEGRYGFIDTTGKVVIAPSFHNAGLFAGEYAEVRLGDASGIINRSGVLVISPRFQRIIPFTGDTFIAEPLREKQRKNPHSDRRLRGFTDPFSLISMEHAGLFHIRRGWLSDQNLKFALRIPRHSDTQPTLIRTPVPRSFGQAVGAQRRRGGIVSLRCPASSISASVCALIHPSD